MKATLLGTLILSTILFFGCKTESNQGDGSVTEVKVEGKSMLICNFDAVKEKKTLLLSDLVEDLQLIHFENIDEAFFKAWFISVYDHHIGVRQGSGAPYKLFDKSGKFISNVGARGQGPGEYSISPYDDIIDEKNGIVYLAPFARNPYIFSYDMKGNFLGNISTPYPLKKPKLHLSSDGSLAFVNLVFQNDSIMGGQLNKKGEILKEVAPIENSIGFNFNPEIFATRNTNAFDFQHTSIDSLFHYDLENNMISPVFTTNIPGEKSFKQYLETKDYFFTLAWGKDAIIATNKKEKTSSFVKLVNDFYGNMEFPINVMTLRNGYYVLSLEPGELIEKIEKRLAETNCSADDRESLNKLLPTLDDNSNNVLFYGKLKK